MNWQDFLIEPACNRVLLRSGLASAFSLPADRVAVVDSIVEAPEGMLVIAEQFPALGDFLCQISVYAADDVQHRDPLETIGKLCTVLRVRALVPGPSDDPYAMILIDPTAGARAVCIDAHRLDQFNEYRLVNDFES